VYFGIYVERILRDTLRKIIICQYRNIFLAWGYINFDMNAKNEYALGMITPASTTTLKHLHINANWEYGRLPFRHWPTIQWGALSYLVYSLLPTPFRLSRSLPQESARV